ncbi:MAG TPA: hypothetical protein VH281_10830 [Gaiellaceae bacterium]|jgi:hypothetical protein
MGPRQAFVLVVIVVAAVACSDAVNAAAATPPEQQLASRYSPVVELKRQKRLCGPGEPYRPVSVDLVLGRQDVSLFDGAGRGYRRLRRAPTAADLFNGPSSLYVDLPGHPITGRCGYQRWFRRIGKTAEDTVYAHVATERGRPGRLALQYWFYYVYNDFNDKHESDWEMVQLDFDAGTVEEALQRSPVAVFYSQHEGAERASWDDDKLQKVGATHIVTYPGAGSHANYYRSALWLGRSADEGLGCDDSTGPSTRIAPRAVVLPTRVGPSSPFAWITFQGHWGQRERAFNDGPFGPNAKLQWSHPFSWEESVARSRSFTVPGSAHAGLDSSDFFCTGVAAVSDFLDAVYASSWTVFAVIVVLVGLLVLSVASTRWRPAPLRPLEQPRAAGQILRVSFGVYRLGWRTLFVVSALVLPFTFLAALAAHVIVDLGPGQDLVQALGRESLLPVHVYVLLLAAIEVVPLGLAVAATAVAVASLRIGEEQVGTTGAYERAVHHARPLAGILLRVVGIPLLLATTIIGLPVAIWYLGRTAVAIPACVLEDLDRRAAIRRSKVLVGPHFWHVSAPTTLAVVVALLAGPFVGAVVLLKTELPVLLANLIGVGISAALMPFVGITVTLLFLDLRARASGPEPAAVPAPAPAN